jgi:WD40 repeat protein
VVVWETASGTPVRSFPAGSPVRAVACSPGGDLAASGNAAGWVMVGNLATEQLVSKPAKLHESLVGLGFLANDRIVTAGSEGRILARSVVPSSQAKEMQIRAGDPISSFVLSEDRKRVLFASGTKVRFASVDGEGSEPLLEETRARVSSLALSTDGELAFVGAADGALELRTLTDGKTRRFGTLTGDPIAAAFSPDGLRVLVATRQGMIRVLDVTRRGELDAIDLSRAGERANALAFLPDRRTFVACTERGVVLRFELKR